MISMLKAMPKQIEDGNETIPKFLSPFHSESGVFCTHFAFILVRRSLFGEKHPIATNIRSQAAILETHQTSLAQAPVLHLRNRLGRYDVCPTCQCNHSMGKGKSDHEGCVQPDPHNLHDCRYCDSIHCAAAYELFPQWPNS